MPDDDSTPAAADAPPPRLVEDNRITEGPDLDNVVRAHLRPDTTAPTEPDWQAIAADAVEALRLTREYVSPIVRLAAWPGWSWFDATNAYLQAAGLPLLEQEPVPAPGPATEPPEAYTPGYTTTDRGFKHLEPVPSTYAGRVRVYESSAADGPHLWLTITQPADLNEPAGPELSARAHLTAYGAEEVALQLLWLLEHHYQGASGSARATAAIRALLAGDASTITGTLPEDELARLLAENPPPLFTQPPAAAGAPPQPAADERPALPGGTWWPVSGPAPRTGWYWIGSDRALPYLPPLGTRRQIRATHPAGFRRGQWADLLGDVRVEANGTLRKCYVVRFGKDGFIDLWPVDDPSDPYEFRTAAGAAPDHAATRLAGELTQLTLGEVARHLEQGEVFTAAGDWAPDTAAVPWHRLGRRLILRGVRRGRAQVAVYLRILLALNNADEGGHTGGRSDRPTRPAPTTAEAATE